MVPGVMTRPSGERAKTRMLCSFTSSASPSLSLRSACFVTEYEMFPPPDWSAAMDEMLITTPPRRSIMCGSTAWGHNTRVVDQDVDPAELSQRRLHQRAHAPLVRRVGAHRQRAHAQRPEL